MITGWYDWALNDALATWALLMREAHEPVKSRSRLLITPSAHNTPGYHEGQADQPELNRNFRTPTIIDLLLKWYAANKDQRLDTWPRVIYYLMGANQWRTAEAWPPLETHTVPFFLQSAGRLTLMAPTHACEPDRYTYDPRNPTPTLGGSIVSYVYPPGSIDVTEAQRRPDVLVYTSAPLAQDLDVIGSLRISCMRARVHVTPTSRRDSAMYFPTNAQSRFRAAFCERDTAASKASQSCLSRATSTDSRLTCGPPRTALRQATVCASTSHPPTFHGSTATAIAEVSLGTPRLRTKGSTMIPSVPRSSWSRCWAALTWRHNGGDKRSRTNPGTAQADALLG